MVRTQISFRCNRMTFGPLKALILWILVFTAPCRLPIRADESNIPEVGANTAVVITNTLNVRSDPGLQSTVKATLDYGDVVEVLSREYKWSRIQYDADEGWVYSSYLKFDCRGWVAVATLNVREEASLHSEIIFRLKRGAPVQILDDQEQWSYIAASGEYGWVYKSLISMSPVNPTDETEQRRRQFLAQNPALPNIFKRAIEHGTFFIGMSREQVAASLGQPQEIIEHPGSPSKAEQWIYSFKEIAADNGDVSSGAQTIHLNFQSDYLTSWGLGFPGNNP